MMVKSINWISKSAEDAEVEITDGEFTCIAFSQPCSVETGDYVTAPLHIFSIKNPMISQDNTVGIWSINEKSLERKVVAKLVDHTQQLIAVGKILLLIDDYLPGGISDGDIIEFRCKRIDLW